MTQKEKNKFQNLVTALSSLNEAIANNNQSSFLRDSIIQRFEYTFELSWKVLQNVLNEQGVETFGPKDILRKAGQHNLLDEIEAWLKFLEVRNLTTHVYNEEIAKQVLVEALKFPQYVEKLVASINAIEVSNTKP